LAAPPQRRLIVFSGPPCSGKTTLAESLAFRTGIPYVQMDSLRHRLLPDGDHGKEQRDIAYRAVHLIAEAILRLDHPAILDATYGPDEHRQELEQIARQEEAPVFLVECRVTPETAARRFRKRAPGHPAVDLTPERVAALVRDYPYSGEGLAVDTEGSIETCLAHIESYLISGPPVRLGVWSAACQAPLSVAEVR